MRRIILISVVFLLACSTGPSKKTREYIEKSEKESLKFPLTYQSYNNWKITQDTLKAKEKVYYLNLKMDTKSKPDDWELIELIEHSFSGKNAYGVPTETKTVTIVCKDGSMEYLGEQ